MIEDKVKRDPCPMLHPLDGRPCEHIASSSVREDAMAHALRVALEREEIALVYQPIVRLSDRSIVGFEALSRWTMGDSNHINPELFISIAERYGMIARLTLYVLDRIAREVGELLRDRPDLFVTINISSQELLDDRVQIAVENVCRTRKIPCSCVAFEITERTSADLTLMKRGIDRIRKSGHPVFLDDFATGYSGIAQLVTLDIDGVKLDGSMVEVAHKGSKAIAIADAVARMMRDINLEMIVEGIETEEQLAQFASLPGVELGQGWLFHRPLSLDDLILKCK
ncbi:EAL domain-containing protein [Pseudoxanthobacter soli]|nr:EAL domain-containing protein [Pseudoxanthobacter soli]